ncbi:MAG TPA: TonB-dependent receptor [Gemmatimonadaceae bacterium]|jgi:hemoglobin/transferrin/lactoferrin receptor protein
MLALTPTSAARVTLSAAAFLLVTAVAGAQQANTNSVSAADSTRARRSTSLGAVTVTATRRATDVQAVPTPVSVLDSTVLRERQPNTAADLLRELPGVDVIGTGTNQARPSIRGQRGQRILLLQDGLRLNNARRQQDFGEIPGIVDVATIQRVEVVRGPASVLYGTDAIGGVMNIITKVPSFAKNAPRAAGALGYRYGSAGQLTRGEASLSGRAGNFVVLATGAKRDAGNYDAPKGRYGHINFTDDITLQNAGVSDKNASLYLGWRYKSGTGAFVRAETYDAKNAGFGYIDPAIIGGSQTRIQITYPNQHFTKWSAGFSTGVLTGAKVLDKADFIAYRQVNGRDLAQSIFAPFGAPYPPTAGIDIQTRNHTDLTTSGFRAEATKIFSRDIIVYGVDYFHDNAVGRDSSQTTMYGFGPPRPKSKTTPSLPSATLSSTGVFVQNDLRLHDRLSLIVGGRWQRVSSEALPTTGLATIPPGDAQSTGVFATNALFKLTSQLNLVASMGRGFRAPNLVERYFNGPTPEGSAYQSATPDLKPEQSLNTDLGLKFRNDRLAFETFVYRNDIRNAVRISATGAKINNLPEYRNVNVGKLRASGYEATGTMLFAHGLSASANYSQVKSVNLLDRTIPIGDTYATKLVGTVGWRAASGRGWVEYAVRRNGEQKDIIAGSSPVGNTLPAFVVQNLRGGAHLFTIGGMRQDLDLQVNNLTNKLYAEAANAGFFRPEPGRNVVVAVRSSF